MKKSIKKIKKNLEIRKSRRIFVAVIKQQSNMKKIIITRASRKHQKDVGKMKYNIALALSKFTAIMVGKPDEYKTTDGCINYYPSDILDYWQYSTINANGEIINEPDNKPSEVAGVICTGAHYCNDAPQEITVMFKDL